MNDTDSQDGIERFELRTPSGSIYGTTASSMEEALDIAARRFPKYRREDFEPLGVA